jgi:hypothetical protein
MVTTVVQHTDNKRGNIQISSQSLWSNKTNANRKLQNIKGEYQVIHIENWMENFIAKHE